ncbi:tetratricopeptide repeat protein [Roseibium polysiphoniae]|uniref:tetratricopeptide repeat protein n=1 Tax=Roseibium polysiphoniae TaxID=2571221 RepID=UPI003299954E
MIIDFLRTRSATFLCTIVVSFGVFLAPAVIKAQPAEDLSTRMEAAAALIVTARDAQGAIAAYLSIHKDHPDEIRPIYNLARLYVAEEDWTRARDWFIRYRDHPQLPDGRRQVIVAMIGDLKELISNDADPEKRRLRQYEAALNNARARLEAGDPEAAFTEAQIASSIEPTRPEAYAMAAAILMEDGDCDGAAAFIAQGVELARDDEARSLLGKASEACDRSVDYVSRTNAARKAFAEDRFVEAADLYSEVFKDFPEDTDSAMAAATAYAIASQYAKSAAILTSLASSDDPKIAGQANGKLVKLAPFLRPVAPDNKAVVENLPGAENYAQALDALKAGEADEARILFDEAIRQVHLSAEMADYFLGRGRARGRLGQTDGAIADYRLASLLDPSRGEPHVALASMLVKAGRIPQAISELSSAIDLEDPEAPSAGLRLMRGRLNEKAGDYDAAFEDYRAAIDAGAQAGEIVKAYHQRAVSLAKEGSLVRARVAFERGAKIAPYAPLARDYEAFRQVTFALLSRTPSGARGETYRSGDWDGDWISEKWQADYSITNLTWGADKWTVVMASDETIGAQRIRFSDAFPKEDIKQAWDDGFFVDRLVPYEGSWLLLASERDYSVQSWARRDTLDKNELMNRIREKGEITDLSFDGGSWVIVNTRGSGMRDQKVETDDSFPAAAIEKWSAQGYALSQLAYGSGSWWAVFSRGQNLGASEVFASNHLTGEGVNSLKQQIRDGWQSGLRNLHFVQITTDPK